jgi:hypothetical protein
MPLMGQQCGLAATYLEWEVARAVEQICDLRTAARCHRIGKLLTEHAQKLWVDEDWQMDVTDDTGLILFVINVGAMQSSAIPKPLK